MRPADRAPDRTGRASPVPRLTNCRASGKDDAVCVTLPWKLTLEQAIAEIDDDELVEVTPKAISLRNRWLDPNDRKRMSRFKAAWA
jgi:GTP-binding protein